MRQYSIAFCVLSSAGLLSMTPNNGGCVLGWVSTSTSTVMPRQTPVVNCPQSSSFALSPSANARQWQGRRTTALQGWGQRQTAVSKSTTKNTGSINGNSGNDQRKTSTTAWSKPSLAWMSDDATLDAAESDASSSSASSSSSIMTNKNDYLQNRRVGIPKSSSRSTQKELEVAALDVVDADADGNSNAAPMALVGAFVVGSVAVLANSFDLSPNDVIQTAQTVMDDPTMALERVVDAVASMGPLGAVYFGVAYTIAEILAIPAIPLTASAGYLFGPVQGTGVVLVSASIAAAISFLIGRTLLRDYVEGVLQDFPKFAKIDKAIGKEGFKLMFLLRLSPVFPFALSNYLYGASSINFSAFFWGTLLGFAPGTMAYVYTGYVGKALTTEGSEVYPWYFYVGGLALLSGLIKVLADTATRIVDELDDEDANVP